MVGRIAVLLSVALLAACVAPVAAQQPGEKPPETAESAEPAGADTDPTRPVLFSIRDEYYKLPGDVWQNVFMVRGDALLLKKAKLPGQAHGLILRGDLPLVTIFDDGTKTTVGIGDLYGQALMIPRLSRGVMLAFGSGLTIPTASDKPPGKGKWIAAPVVAPVWFFPKKGFAFIKFQDWFSFAGQDDRPDVHYFTVTPTALWRLGKRWWTLVDAESNTNWEKDNRTSFRGGFLIGRMFSPHYGVSLKTELPFGGWQQTDWTLKLVFFAIRR